MLNSDGLVKAISETDYRDFSVTVVGYGYMGKEYVKALRALGVRKIRVCSRSAEPLLALQDVSDVEVVSGGYDKLYEAPLPYEWGIVATPLHDLIGAAKHLVTLGYKKLLIEKPISLFSNFVQDLHTDFQTKGVEAFCAYNRTVYPAFYEVLDRASADGGITSCVYDFTEMIRPNWPEKFPPDELGRWGVSNSLHVMSMAHGLVGLPQDWRAYQGEQSAIAWHPSGSVYVGAGVSDQGIPFSYHANWGAVGRWSVEVRTAAGAYLLCPMEKLQFKKNALDDWEEIPLGIFDADIKAGVLELVASILTPDKITTSQKWDLVRSHKLMAFGEDILGYTL